MITTENIKHSKKSMASYGCAKALNEFIDMAFTAFGFYYYESEIGLNVWLVSLGYIIFAIYNAINDPLVGYLTDRPFKFTKKWGRRFPWIILGGVLWVISYILIFTPPSVDPKSGALILFAWLIFATCLYDTFASIFFVSFSSLFPDKFRSVEERRTANAIATPVGILGIVAGGIVPPLFITFGEINTYVIQAGAMVIIGLIVLALAIPGCRDDQEIVDRYLAKYDTDKSRDSFFKSFKTALKQKSFVVFILAYTFYRACVMSMQSSVPYLVRFFLGMPASALILIMAGMLVGAIISIPFWLKISNKINDNRKVAMIAGMLMTIGLIPLFILESYIGIIIGMLVWGFFFGGFWVILAPLLADVIDESVAKSEKREEGVYTGFQQFFGRLAIIMQALSFAIVHTLTGFNEGGETQSPLALLGIQIHFALIPMVFMLIAVLLLWKFYDLTPDKVKANQDKVTELGL